MIFLFKYMRQLDYDELSRLNLVIVEKDKYDAYQYQIAKKTLSDRRDYLYPIFAEFAKRGISVKDVCFDLYNEFLIIASILSQDERSIRIDTEK